MREIIDMTGMKFGKLTVLQRHGNLWACGCSCGNITYAVRGNLIKGATKSCGCRDGVNIVGQKFKRFTVLRKVVVIKGNSHYECQCECGNKIVISRHNLIYCENYACGCYFKEVAGSWSATHRKTGSPEYVSWSSMRRRCLNSKDDAYPNYGGRGIKICPRWSDFQNFLEDMGMRPTMNHSLERINNEKGYSPSNCKWALSIEQTQNRRNTRRLTAFGKTLTLTEWERLTGIYSGTIHTRVKKGMAPEEALTLTTKRGNVSMLTESVQ